ncbi:MAG: hypothetical protein Q7S40_27720 [Opitutaceae bacterium]|nr:hypothetical protein [Opitutaceae bacterium]
MGSSPYPILAHLAADESFHGTVLLDIVPAMYLAPAGSPPVEASEKALRRYHSWNHAQRWSHGLAVPLEGHVAFLRLPVTGPLAGHEEKIAPRAATWDRLVRENAAPAIHFADHADLREFQCPEYSHLSAPDSVEFTRRLVPYLRAAMQPAAEDGIIAAAASSVPPAAEESP